MPGRRQRAIRSEIVVRFAGHGMDAGPADRQRPNRGHGLWRHGRGSLPAQRGHTLVRRSSRLRPRRRRSVPAANPPVALRGQAERGAATGDGAFHVRAARTDALPAVRRSGADVPGPREGGSLPTRTRSRHGHHHHDLSRQWRHLHPPGDRELAGPGDHRTNRMRPPGSHQLHRNLDQPQPGRADPGLRRRHAGHPRTGP